MYRGPSLEHRRLYFDLLWCYKLLFGLVRVNRDDFFTLRLGRPNELRDATQADDDDDDDGLYVPALALPVPTTMSYLYSTQSLVTYFDEFDSELAGSEQLPTVWTLTTCLSCTYDTMLRSMIDKHACTAADSPSTSSTGGAVVRC